ncbi:LytTR family DNA-binding domain-containing protein [Roseovarius sp. 2305UL8-3]|uniref:LytTR family DNA-binding domain-containing protein n=1 Tax=Roseovarius conchicola TaxID=3121636 RepID=UPI003527E381
MPNLEEIRKSFAVTYERLFSPITGFIFAVCWLGTVVAGPFGTYEAMDWELRTFYWFCVVAGAIFLGFGVYALSVALVGLERPWTTDLLASMIMTVVFAPCVFGLRMYLAQFADGLYVNGSAITANTFILSVAIFALRRRLQPCPTDEELITAARERAMVEPRLLRRLPPELRAPVLRLSANDHHVEVATEMGRATLRLRLTDAINEMEPVEGMCTHRSHWVALAAIVGVDRGDRQKTLVVLSNGDRIPVSRKYRPALEEAGIVPKTVPTA